MSTGGSTSSTAGTATASAGGPGTQPLGAICNSNEQCAQSQGVTVCCENACTLGEACASDPLYLPCESTPDCAQYGGGRLCCELMTGNDVMRFCTKRSACSGQILP
jgi:hypothetical protein